MLFAKEELWLKPDPRAQGERNQPPKPGGRYLKDFSPQDPGERRAGARWHIPHQEVHP